MTAPTMKVELTISEINLISDMMMERGYEKGEEPENFASLGSKIEPAFIDLDLMSKGKKFYEDDRVILWEHPNDSKSEKSLMAYLKEKQYFEKDTGEYEPNEFTADIVVKKMRAAFRAL